MNLFLILKELFFQLAVDHTPPPIMPAHGRSMIEEIEFKNEDGQNLAYNAYN